ncbi:MAG: hypothetical protein NVV74_08065 [Magnetospirillum sp.]|nr:hypothetical protein [Magnetospirillum sp.]
MRDVLIRLAENDRRLRSQLALSGQLFAGYHPSMRALHEANARELELLVDEDGWPTTQESGADGVGAAFLIAVHAISRPAFLRRCLTLMKSAANRGDIPAWHPATLEDRIRSLEGRPQIYGTQLDWDDDHRLSPLPIEDEEVVDERRAKVGLPPWPRRWPRPRPAPRPTARCHRRNGCTCSTRWTISPGKWGGADAGPVRASR